MRFTIKLEKGQQRYHSGIESRNRRRRTLTESKVCVAVERKQTLEGSQATGAEGGPRGHEVAS